MLNEDRISRQNEFIKRAKEVHGDRFDYSRVYYINNCSKVCILYNGKELWQTPINHLRFKGTQGVNAMERKTPKKMMRQNWEKYKKYVKKESNKRYRKKVKKNNKENPDYTPRKRLRVKKYKCKLCGISFKRKEEHSGYKGIFCSRGCVRKYNLLTYLKKKLDEKLSYKYIIITTEYKKKKEDIGKYKGKREAIKKFQELVNESNSVKLPQRYVVVNEICEKLDNEILLIERNEDEKKSLNDRDEIGKLVTYKVVSKDKDDKFIVFNKHPLYSEQMFGILGDDIKVDVTYIINNILITDNENKNIMVYNNNLIVKTENDIKLILSEHQNIIFDLYNYLQKYCKKNKINYINFMGLIDGSRMLKKYYNDLIKKKYGIQVKGFVCL